MVWRLIHADCIEAMRGMDESSVDAIVTDPPYGLEFMGKEWDRLGGTVEAFTESQVDGRTDYHGKGNAPFGGGGQRVRYGASAMSMQEWHYAWALEALRVLKPGAHLLSFGGTRTYHRLTCALEDAGFEIRDCLAWLYGSGFPKSLDVSKAIDKAAGVAREDKFEGSFDRRNGPTGNRKCETCGKWLVSGSPCRCPRPQDAAVTLDAHRWQGWGTALKPAFEPVVLARKPLSERNVAANVQRWGTGALNVDGCRIGFADDADEQESKGKNRHGDYGTEQGGNEVYGDFSMLPPRQNYEAPGRWPANVLLDEEAAAALDEQSGERRGNPPNRSPRTERELTSRGYKGGGFGQRRAEDHPTTGEYGQGYADSGGASRFFYTAKASRQEREGDLRKGYGVAPGDLRKGTGIVRDVLNHHPTVKPVDLMQWLCRLVTPPGGIILDPFTGSGSTGIAALREGFDFIGIEKEAEYVDIARARIIGDAPLLNMSVLEGSEYGPIGRERSR